MGCVRCAKGLERLWPGKRPPWGGILGGVLQWRWYAIVVGMEQRVGPVKCLRSRESSLGRCRYWKNSASDERLVAKRSVCREGGACLCSGGQSIALDARRKVQAAQALAKISRMRLTSMRCTSKTASASAALLSSCSRGSYSKSHLIQVPSTYSVLLR